MEQVELDMALADWLGEKEKPRGRYMADVRHPLKSRRLDDRPKLAQAPRLPFVPKAEVPREAPCAKCGKVVSIDEWWAHSCFGPRFGVCK